MKAAAAALVVLTVAVVWASAQRRPRNDVIIFPGPVERQSAPQTGSSLLDLLTPQQMDELDTLDNVEDVIALLSPSGSLVLMEPPVQMIRKTQVFESRSAYFSQKVQLRRQNSTTSLFAQAKCLPRNRTVCLPKPAGLHQMYFPSCVEIEQCEGCCFSNPMRSCQPLKAENVAIEVNLLETNDSKKREKLEVFVEKHTKCGCRCITKKKDCTAKQRYNETKCVCQCKNESMERECRAVGNIKTWDRNKCECVCLETEHCATGLHFNTDTCRCEKAW
ncbi:hypothetical protein ONE63_001660 [Megalurothrips usitatus]|uniref:Platelet-derived growth factor (PDGF) family profile domain-containing protein n=1 Tax=Megalurothrips usitatus TaxID=439358 RepID=A0AAV7XD72_9NEOP|nr:hypothetical protein ONE63_001660 [Megalurothrips usitatus]